MKNMSIKANSKREKSDSLLLSKCRLETCNELK